jgi:hypothetical protein
MTFAPLTPLHLNLQNPYPPSISLNDWLFDLGIEQVRHPEEKGVGWDPPIPAANEWESGGGLVEEVGPLSHP